MEITLGPLSQGDCENLGTITQSCPLRVTHFLLLSPIVSADDFYPADLADLFSMGFTSCLSKGIIQYLKQICPYCFPQSELFLHKLQDGSNKWFFIHVQTYFCMVTFSHLCMAYQEVCKR